ncbi:MAG: diguanylate cyclase [Nitrospirae bacterium]|nr:diguanylate cyclase [Nitrospirota bacterium]
MAIDKQLNDVKERYQRQLPVTIQVIGQMWRQYEEDPGDITLLQGFRNKIHSLKGASAIFGLSGLNEAASELSVIVNELIKSETDADPEQRKRIGYFLDMLKSLSGYRGEGWLQDIGSLYASVSGKAADTLNGERNITLLADDHKMASDMSAYLECFGFNVNVVTNLDDFKSALSVSYPSAVVMEISFPGGTSKGMEYLGSEPKLLNSAMNVVCLSEKTDFQTRLKAVRSGCKAFLTRPLNYDILVDKLNYLTSFKEYEPYKILIVEDDPTQAEYYELILRYAGMDIARVSHPDSILTEALDFSPDLVLMNLYMHECNGLELASVIRQESAMVSVPIVFLSAETNVNEHMLALSAGGDDFLIKADSAEYLIASIISRVQRARTLRRIIVRDSMTGLFNHTNTKYQLDIAVAYAKRSGSPLAFALLDIDNFKSVNDERGHQAGDRVIKSLSGFLQQRLRKSDIIGRYGGEEFAIIMYNTNVDAALRLVDSLREEFGKIVHRFEGLDFSVTFSGGISCFPQYANPHMILRVADLSLYEAKKQGRNRIVLTK